MNLRLRMLIGITLVTLAGCAKKTEPDCFECGIKDEWAQAEAEEQARQEPEADNALETNTASDSDGTPPPDQTKVAADSPADEPDTPTPEDANASEESASDARPVVGPGATHDPTCSDANARDECAAKGAQWLYARQPYVRCKGTAPSPEEQERIRDMTQSAPCVCYNREVVERRRERCSMIPSRAPGPGKQASPLDTID